MAATKKVIAVNKSTIISNSTNRKFFNNYPDSYDDGPGENIDMGIRNGNSEFELGIEIEQDQFCCGLYSLGNFSLNDSTNFSIQEKAEVVKEGLQKLLGVMKEKSKEITLLFTLIDNPACKIIKQAVADGELFTKVKTFNNLNSSRVNELYISN